MGYVSKESERYITLVTMDDQAKTHLELLVIEGEIETRTIVSGNLK
jgi:hypothetical protein